MAAAPRAFPLSSALFLYKRLWRAFAKHPTFYTRRRRIASRFPSAPPIARVLRRFLGSDPRSAAGRSNARASILFTNLPRSFHRNATGLLYHSFNPAGNGEVGLWRQFYKLFKEIALSFHKCGDKWGKVVYTFLTYGGKAAPLTAAWKERKGHTDADRLL